MLGTTLGDYVLAAGRLGRTRAGDLDSRWILLARNASVLEHPELAKAVREPPEKRVLWTDDFSNLLRLLK